MGAPRPYPKHTGGVPKYGQGPRLSAANTVGMCLPDATRVWRRESGLGLMLRNNSILLRGRKDKVERDRADVGGPQFAGVLGIGLSAEGDLLALSQGAEAGTLDGGEVDEHVAAAVVVVDEAEALGLIEPFHSAGIH